MSDACIPSELWVGGEVKRGQTTLVPSTVVSAKATLINNETYNKTHGYIFLLPIATYFEPYSWINRSNWYHLNTGIRHFMCHVLLVACTATGCKWSDCRLWIMPVSGLHVGEGSASKGEFFNIWWAWFLKKKFRRARYPLPIPLKFSPPTKYPFLPHWRIGILKWNTQA